MFIPSRVIIEEKALEYKLGEELLNRFRKENKEIVISKGRISGIPGNTPREMYVEGKSTLVIGIRKTLEFQSCKPSAHYQLPLVSGCMGMCEYCYLNTQLGKRPYTKIHVNLDDIFEKAMKYVEERKSDITIFEGAATSDPIPVEPYTGALGKAIELFGSNEYTKFRFVTKYGEVDSLLNLKHNGRTTVRFSINTDNVIRKFEHNTNGINERIEGAYKIAKANYPLGFIIAPVFLYDNWRDDYKELINRIGELFKGHEVSFEIISHRFTKRAKENILSIYPKSLLPMDEEIRRFKYGQFGYGKYVYLNEEINDMKNFFYHNITKYFDEKNINYII